MTLWVKVIVFHCSFLWLIQLEIGGMIFKKNDEKQIDVLKKHFFLQIGEIIFFLHLKHFVNPPPCDVVRPDCLPSYPVSRSVWTTPSQEMEFSLINK